MRKTARVTIDEEGRDKGKIFVITEMAASRAEKWGTAALLALTRSNAPVPESLVGAGMAGIAVIGLQMLGGLATEEAFSLMDEMFTCVKIIPDPSNPSIIRDLIEDDIEEVATRAKLRAEIFTLHTGFSLAGVLSRLMPAKTLAVLPNT